MPRQLWPARHCRHHRRRRRLAVSKAKILASNEMYIKSGSDINLTCVARQAPLPPLFIYWYKNGHLINHSNRGGINIITERLSRTSKLVITRATTADSGNYTCAPGDSGKQLHPTFIFIPYFTPLGHRGLCVWPGAALVRPTYCANYIASKESSCPFCSFFTSLAHFQILIVSQ